LVTNTHKPGIESHYPKMIGAIQPATFTLWLSALESWDVATLLSLILSKQGEMTQVNLATNRRLARSRQMWHSSSTKPHLAWRLRAKRKSPP
jgi:hypothetical protein